MDLTEIMLNEAEETWRETIRVEFPLFFDTPVVKAKADPKNQRHWMFYTDGTTTHMDVFKPKLIEKIFRETIAPMYLNAYGQNVNLEMELIGRLIHDNFTYLYFHEQFHPTFCPDSKGDEEQVDKALYEGIEKALPRLSKAQILKKVGNVRNAGWDQIIDGAFYELSGPRTGLNRRLQQVLTNAEIPLEHLNNLPDAVVPIFDIIEFNQKKKEKFDSLFYPLSRALYGLLFTRGAEMREQVFDYFKDRIVGQMRNGEKEFNSILPEALKGAVKELSRKQLQFARIDRQNFESRVDEMYQNYSDPSYDTTHAQLSSELNSLFLDKRSRYDAMKGFIQPLAKYISENKEEKRHGTHIGQGQSSQGQAGNGQPESGDGQSGQGQPSSGQGQAGDEQSTANQPGGNTEQALINLANVLGEPQASQLLAQVANQLGSQSGSGMQGGEAQKDKKLSMIACDEYYKRHAKEVDIRSPDYEAVQIDLGIKREAKLIGSLYLGSEEVVNLNHDAILQFQEETGIAQLTQISDHQFKFDEYEWVETQDYDFTHENTGLDLPDNIIFHVDSSGSMGSVAYVNSNQAYDVLMHTCFGILKTMRKAAKEMNKEIQVMVANFSNGTILSSPVELGHMYDTPNNEAKQALTGFQGGGTVYSPNTFSAIESKLKAGKTVHIWASDGGLSGSTVERSYQEIAKVAATPNTSFLYFEIGGNSSFGSRIKGLADQHANVQYFGNTTIAMIQSESLEVMLEYNSKVGFKDLI